MNIFITATDTDVGKTYVSRGIVEELSKRGKKTGYFKPFQSGVIPNVLSDVENVLLSLQNNDNIHTKNSYITKTPCTPSVSAEIDGIEIDINEVLSDYKRLKETCEIVITEGSGGLLVPINSTMLISNAIKALDLPVIIVARPNLGTINHTLLTINALREMNISILGVVISNYPKNAKDPAITTAPALIEKFGKVSVIDIIEQNSTNFKKVVDTILSQ